MLNPFKYKPVRITTTYKDMGKPNIYIVVGLFSKKDIERMKIFIEPVEGQYEYQQLSERIMSYVGYPNYHAKIAELTELYNKVSTQWEEKFKQSSRSTLLQLNYYVSLLDRPKYDYQRTIVGISEHYDSSDGSLWISHKIEELSWKEYRELRNSQFAESSRCRL